MRFFCCQVYYVVFCYISLVSLPFRFSHGCVQLEQMDVERFLEYFYNIILETIHGSYVADVYADQHHC